MSPPHRNVRRLFCRDNTSQSSRDSVCRLPELSGTSKAIPPAPACLESSFSVGWASKQSRQIGTSRAGQPASVGRSDLSRGHQALDRKAGVQPLALFSGPGLPPVPLDCRLTGVRYLPRPATAPRPRPPGRLAEHWRESGVCHECLV